MSSSAKAYFLILVLLALSSDRPKVTHISKQSSLVNLFTDSNISSLTFYSFPFNPSADIVEYTAMYPRGLPWVRVLIKYIILLM
jgi:hypothetical protein